MRVLGLAALFLAVPLLPACNRGKLPSSIEVWPETERVFSEHGKDFRACLSKALGGSDSDILQFISQRRFALNSGAGSYGFGVALLGVAQYVGDERFSRAVTQMAPEDKEHVWSLLTAGADYGRSKLTDEELHRQLPKTMNILDEAKPKRPNQSLEPTAGRHENTRQHDY
jgi:hypothetical protein